jgi:predicted RNA binding protein YcfA (HicA-like mRNA interferase family)
MPRLPRISGQEAVAAFRRAGWVLSRMHGSHQILRHPETGQHLSVPGHDTLKPGLLADLIKRAELTVDEFVDLLR